MKNKSMVGLTIAYVLNVAISLILLFGDKEFIFLGDSGSSMSFEGLCAGAAAVSFIPAAFVFAITLFKKHAPQIKEDKRYVFYIFPAIVTILGLICFIRNFSGIFYIPDQRDLANAIMNIILAILLCGGLLMIDGVLSILLLEKEYRSKVVLSPKGVMLHEDVIIEENDKEKKNEEKDNESDNDQHDDIDNDSVREGQ